MMISLLNASVITDLNIVLYNLFTFTYHLSPAPLVRILPVRINYDFLFLAVRFLCVA